jgi:hypothetical protein
LVEGLGERHRARRSAKPSGLFRFGDVGALDGGVEPEFVCGDFFGLDGLAAGLASVPSGAKDDIDSFNRGRFGVAIWRT